MDMMSLRRRVLVNQNKLVSATGNPLTFNTPLTKPLKECVVRFTPKQEGEGTPSPDNVRNIVGKNEIIVWQSNDDRSRPLPKEYQQVEYIGTTGTQWLDTGVVPTVNTKSQIKMSAKEMSGYVFYGLFTGDDATDYRFFINNSRMYWDLPGGRVQTTFGTAATKTVYELELGNRYIKDLLTDTYLVASKTRLDFELTETITLNSYNGTLFSKSNWYYVKIYESNTLIRDLVPCYRKSDSVAGMYDRVSGTFYTNSGTGEFVVGEDIVGTETSVSFPAVGKNLIDESFLRNTDNYYVGGNYGYIYTDWIYLEPNTQYKFTWFDYDVDAVTAGHLYVQNANQYIVNNGNHRQYGTFTTNAEGTIRFGANKGSYSTVQDFLTAVFDNGKLQLEKGTGTDTYEAFNNTVYGGYVDLVNGELVQEWAYTELNGNSEEEWAIYRPTIMDTYTFWIGVSGKVVEPFLSKCDRYKNSRDVWGSAGLNKYSVFSDHFYLSRWYFKPPYDGFEEDLSAWREWLTNNPLHLAYKLATPIHYPIPPHILSTLKGQNVMWSDTNEDITVRYWTR